MRDRRRLVVTWIQYRILRGTVLECWNVLRAKMGHDPYGMLLKDRPWPEIVQRTYRSHRDCERGKYDESPEESR